MLSNDIGAPCAPPPPATPASRISPEWPIFDRDEWPDAESPQPVDRPTPGGMA